MNMNLSVKIANLKFSNPVTVASGTFGAVGECWDLKAAKQLGAIVPKTVTLLPQQGNLPPRIVETPSGMVNAIGIENDGIDAFIENKLSMYAKIGVPVIVSISGKSDEEFQIMAEKLAGLSSVSAIELNLSCPNLKHKVLVAQDAGATQQVVALVRKIVNQPIIAKLSPNVTSIADIAAAAEAAGADAVSMVNTFQAMVIDVEKRKSMIGNFTGGLSGPAIRPIAVNMVYQTAQRIKIPIMAMGGISNAEDALQFLIAGATMVAVGTMSFIDPNTAIKVLDGIKVYMRKHKINDIKDLIGFIK
ncbi:MAG: dihydroorotate dehydrogenase [Candidatus Omnitrophica bacterium]|nr:dihydroorotate dehydrogenase [Candidatus Omnitrophota bacterium]